MEKLKPCPFCGGKNIRIWKTSAPFVSCDDCLASTGCALTVNPLWMNVLFR